MDFAKCTESTNGKTIAVEESGRKFVIKNPKAMTVKKVKVDGCLIDDNRERCDYLFELGSVAANCAVYLELKGADIEKAIDQLTKTVGYLKNIHKCKKICHIVASRVPKAGPKVQTLRLEMAKKHGILLYVGTRQVTVNIDKAPYA